MHTILKKKETRKAALGFLGIILWLYILSTLDLSKVISISRNMHWYWIVIALVPTALGIPLKAQRWNIFLRNLGQQLKFREALQIVVNSTFWGSLTPARLGELYRFKPFLGNKEALLNALASVVLDRAYDLLLIGTITWIGVAAYSMAEIRTLVSLGGVVIVLVLAYLLWRYRIQSAFKLAFSRLVPDSLFKGAAVDFSVFQKAFVTASRGNVAIGFVLSALALLSACVGLYCVALALSLRIPFVYLSVCYTLAALVSLLPVSYAGIGTRDAVFILYLRQVGVSAESAVFLSLTVTVVYSLALPAVLVLLFPVGTRMLDSLAQRNSRN